MSFFFKFLTGAVIGGSATLYYRDQIASTTSKLSHDLDQLSHQLVKSQQVPHEPVRTSHGVAMIPKRLPLTEEIKARWNEQLANGFESVRSTDWSAVAIKSWQSVKSLTNQAKQEGEALDLSAVSSSRTNSESVQVNERMVDKIDGKL
ncbi:uncharacterized protein JCM15063_002287 [Sporobolomyces koalae]|uniref:uncharacterized protein n=1 Tax=Sporobolomyces koalae TaxID=500713 RepID=UPI00317E3E9F